MKRRIAVVTASGFAAALALTACGGGGEPEDAGTSGPVGEQAEAGGPLDLSDVCPATVVMQQDWQPESEHGAMYHLVGEDYEIDSDAKSVTGSLVVDGTDTGVDVEVRPGGSSVGFQPVSALMYLDTDILVGAVNTDGAIAAHAEHPTVAVTSQMTVSPQMLMWDPETYPDATTIEEAAAGGAPVVTAGELIGGLLVSQGIIQPDQRDSSYEGTPQRFVSDPSILQQGFATSEPYVYENEITEWGRPIAYQLLAEVGYAIYPEPIVVREADVTEQADCLAKLVPILQQAQIDFLADPDATNALIVELVEAYQTGWTYSPEVAEFSVQAQQELGLVTDDPASGVFGQIDPDRMAEIVETFAPILVDAGTIPDAEIDPESLYTNEFIDTSISIGD
ncbi:conserved hypothetical protein [Beutenbergia cavernae DSM 12333]|uniref:Nitrate ABC transporter substrate-binding protein n=1 Tax=Beutenbergia cavernae (strain ATCC BAA-8 / DSM 12333 / CCUG 43141 / JCM 11478 / NBRC 16432 / NCIMB 13614 / HKI 0122) TaxID=471853 RepID=C5C4A5_BEUC1|nr:hypothetical protein [Beutenbergia cavernae]ACQ82029.1 conserved hypothetical protein [Beutenbergia cavernae DSM 12333]